MRQQGRRALAGGLLESPAVATRGRGRANVRVGMISLGCAKNLVDAEVMLGHLAAQGVTITAQLEKADVVVINTCGFVEDAKRESIETILEVAARREAGQVKRLVVAGCMAQRYAVELAQEIPQIDAFVGLDELEHAPAAVLGEMAPGHVPDQRAAMRLYDETHPRLLATGGVYAYVKVAEGCNNPCSFCHIPRMRGAFRSRGIASLVREAQQLEKAGVRELVLVAQDTTRYGEDLGLGRAGLRRLLEALLEGTSIPWIRLLYAYPATLDEGLFPLMAREPRLVPYLDIPLQHASRRILKAMRRGGDARSYRRLIDRARQVVPGLAVRSTFIVGFPGEEEEDLEEVERFLQEVRFNHVGVFAYSWQEENPGAALGDPVPARVKARRRRRLMRAQERISRELYKELRGREVTVLVTGPAGESELLLEGRLPQQAPEVDGRVLLVEGVARPGDLVRARVARTLTHDVVAKITEVVSPAPARRGLLLPTLPAPATTRPGSTGV